MPDLRVSGQHCIFQLATMLDDCLHGRARVVHRQLDMTNVPRTQGTDVVHQVQAVHDILVVRRPNRAIHASNHKPVGIAVKETSDDPHFQKTIQQSSPVRSSHVKLTKLTPQVVSHKCFSKIKFGHLLIE